MSYKTLEASFPCVISYNRKTYYISPDIQRQITRITSIARGKLQVVKVLNHFSSPFCCNQTGRKIRILSQRLMFCTSEA